MRPNKKNDDEIQILIWILDNNFNNTQGTFSVGN